LINSRSFFPLSINKETQDAKDNRPTIIALYADEVVFANKVKEEIYQLILNGFILEKERELLGVHSGYAQKVHT